MGCATLPPENLHKAGQKAALFAKVYLNDLKDSIHFGEYQIC